MGRRRRRRCYIALHGSIVFLCSIFSLLQSASCPEGLARSVGCCGVPWRSLPSSRLRVGFWFGTHHWVGSGLCGFRRHTCAPPLAALLNFSGVSVRLRLPTRIHSPSKADSSSPQPATQAASGGWRSRRRREHAYCIRAAVSAQHGPVRLGPRPNPPLHGGVPALLGAASWCVAASARPPSRMLRQPAPSLPQPHAFALKRAPLPCQAWRATSWQRGAAWKSCAAACGTLWCLPATGPAWPPRWHCTRRGCCQKTRPPRLAVGKGMRGHGKRWQAPGSKAPAMRSLQEGAEGGRPRLLCAAPPDAASPTSPPGWPAGWRPTRRRL